jgi:hypothetical protein
MAAIIDFPLRSRSSYVTDGPLPPGSPTYQTRQADDDLFQALENGDYCYILGPRRNGKTSLILNVSDRLENAGTRAVTIDLRRLGSNLSLEQWYAGMVESMGADLGLEKEMVDYWDKNWRLGPLQRWLTSISNVVLEKIQEPVVLFVDNIELLAGQHLRSEEFFTAISEALARRRYDPQYKRLTICLVGSATKERLTQDTRTNPFDLARLIQIQDLTEAQTRALTSQEPERIYYWTNGHPYLTQLIASTGKPVDTAVKEIFLNGHQETSVAEIPRILENQVDRNDQDAAYASALTLYGQILKGRKVQDSEDDPRIEALKISGLIAPHKETLAIRNRIYEQVYGPRWLKGGPSPIESQRTWKDRGWGIAATFIGFFVFAVLYYAFAFATGKMWEANFHAVPLERQVQGGYLIHLRGQDLAGSEAELSFRGDADIKLTRPVENVTSNGREGAITTSPNFTPGPYSLTFHRKRWWLLDLPGLDNIHTAGFVDIADQTVAQSSNVIHYQPDKMVSVGYLQVRCWNAPVFGNIFMGTNDGNIYALNCSTMDTTKVAGFGGFIQDMALGMDGKRGFIEVTTGKRRGLLEIDPKTWKVLYRETRIGDGRYSLFLSPDDNILYLCDGSANVRRYSALQHAFLAPLNAARGVRTMTVSADGQSFTNENGTVMSTVNGAETREFASYYIGGYGKNAYAYDGVKNQMIRYTAPSPQSLTLPQIH